MTEELVALRAAFGQDEATHGAGRYRVDNDGIVIDEIQTAKSSTE